MHANAVATAGSTRRRAEWTRVVMSGLSKQVEAVADLEQTDRAEADGGKQHHPLEERLPERVEVEDEEEVADGAEHQRAEDRADGAAGAAEQRDAAQHH